MRMILILCSLMLTLSVSASSVCFAADVIETVKEKTIKNVSDVPVVIDLHVLAYENSDYSVTFFYEKAPGYIFSRAPFLQYSFATKDYCLIESENTRNKGDPNNLNKITS